MSKIVCRSEKIGDVTLVAFKNGGVATAEVSVGDSRRVIKENHSGELKDFADNKISMFNLKGNAR